MANVKISQLPAATALATTDVLPLVQGTTTRKTDIASLDSRNQTAGDARYIRKGQEEAPGTELQYLQMTTLLSVTATTNATAQTAIAGVSRSYDGSPILLEFFTPGIQCTAGAGVQCLLTLWEGATDLGWMGQAIASSPAVQFPVYVCRRLTPTAGNHAYTIKVWIAAGTQGYVQGGTGAANTAPPAFLRITKV